MTHSKQEANAPTSDVTVDYLPKAPTEYRPEIGLIGCGGITGDHLTAYRDSGYNVVALCDVDIEQAKKRQTEFFPNAKIFADYNELLAIDSIEVVDIATHTDVRPPIIEAAIAANKHVLSQKPFVLDLDIGERLCDLAERQGIVLAVNQNGRYAPHFSYIRNAVASGLIGDIISIHAHVHWDHGWTADTKFNEIDDLILYDYAIHWYDLVCCLLGDQKPRSVFSSRNHAARQKAKPPLLGQSIVLVDGVQISLNFDGAVEYQQQDRTVVTGTAGTIISCGPDNSAQSLTIETANGVFTPELQGKWFPDGFHGTMAELLCSIEEGRPCDLNARDNLKSLELCFAGVSSSHSGKPVSIGSVRSIIV